MIYTSYFAAIPKLPRANRYISIARFTPSWMRIKMPIFTPLVPSRDILFNYKENHNEVEYTRRYITEHLNRLDCDALYKELDCSILFCYEAPDKFCHRHLVANWFREHGYECREIQLL